MSFQTILVVQARLSSHRLPYKAMLPLINGETILGTVLHNLYGCADVHIVACPSNCTQVFLPIAKKHRYEIVEGPEEDVLKRIFLAYQQFPARWIIRATADNAVVGTCLVQKLLKKCQMHCTDYSCYEGTPEGAGVQILSSHALIAANQEATDPYEREHVCPFVIHRSNRFTLHTPMAPSCWQGKTLRATIDVLKDYKYIQKFYQNYYQRKSYILEEFIKWALTT